MSLLSADAILSKKDIVTRKVDIPEWEGHVFVRMLSGTERDAFEAGSVKRSEGKKGKVKQEPNLANFRARLAALCLCDEQGKRLFTDADAAALGQKCGAALDRIADEALALNRMKDDSVEEEEGNSASGQS